MSAQVDVLIIGAGPAGCATGYRLAKSAKKVLVVEKLDTAGGLSRTVQRNGARYDIGPHRFFTKSPEVSRLWAEMTGDQLTDVQRLTRIAYRRHLLHYPLRPFEALFGLGIMESALALLSYGRARLVRTLVRREPRSFEDWVSDQFGYRLYKMFFKTYSEKVWGIPCTEISSAWASQRIRDLNLAKAVLNALTGGRTAKVRTLVDHFIYPRRGAGTMYEAMCAFISSRGGQLEFDTEVERIHHDGLGRVVSVDVAKRGEHATLFANCFVSTMPITHLVERLDPRPPREILEASHALAYRTHVCVNLLVGGNPFPDNWIYVHDPDVRVGRIANYRNFSKDMCERESRSPLSFEYFAFPGDDIEASSDNTLIDLALVEGRRLGLLPASSPHDAFVVRSPNAYCVIRRGYEEAVRVLKSYLATYHNLITAGRAGLFKYNNQDHSIVTGLLAAQNALGGHHDLWNVNVDAEYHES